MVAPGPDFLCDLAKAPGSPRPGTLAAPGQVLRYWGPYRFIYFSNLCKVDALTLSTGCSPYSWVSSRRSGRRRAGGEGGEGGYGSGCAPPWWYKCQCQAKPHSDDDQQADNPEYDAISPGSWATHATSCGRLLSGISL